jgi:FMN phosphatase YigB (HAD superfamily)
MKIKLFIDFDNTLFDARKLKAPLFEAIKSLGFSEPEILSSYKEASSDYNYSPIEHLKLLQKLQKFNMKNAISKVDKLYEKTPEYLFDDTEDFLKNIDRGKFEVDLLTLGDPDFQKKKVEACGAAKFFDKIYYCKDQKWIFLKTIVKLNEQFYIIDDRGDALFNILKDFKLCHTIEINRAAEPLDNMEQPAPYMGIKVKNFAEAMPYLK